MLFVIDIGRLSPSQLLIVFPAHFLGCILGAYFFCAVCPYHLMVLFSRLGFIYFPRIFVQWSMKKQHFLVPWLNWLSFQCLRFYLSLFLNSFTTIECLRIGSLLFSYLAILSRLLVRVSFIDSDLILTRSQFQSCCSVWIMVFKKSS